MIRDPCVDPTTGVLRNRLGITDAADLAREAGYEVRWRAMDPEENVAVSRASLAGDDGPLRAMLDGLLHEI